MRVAKRKPAWGFQMLSTRSDPVAVVDLALMRSFCFSNSIFRYSGTDSLPEAQESPRSGNLLGWGAGPTAAGQHRSGAGDYRQHGTGRGKYTALHVGFRFRDLFLQLINCFLMVLVELPRTARNASFSCCWMQVPMVEHMPWRVILLCTLRFIMATKRLPPYCWIDFRNWYSSLRWNGGYHSMLHASTGTVRWWSSWFEITIRKSWWARLGSIPKLSFPFMKLNHINLFLFVQLVPSSHPHCF